MKKSQIILGASAFILAIAAAFTSKAKATSNLRTYFTVNSQKFDTQVQCFGGPLACTVITVDGHSRKVYNVTAQGKTFLVTKS